MKKNNTCGWLFVRDWKSLDAVSQDYYTIWLPIFPDIFILTLAIEPRPQTCYGLYQWAILSFFHSFGKIEQGRKQQILSRMIPGLKHCHVCTACLGFMLSGNTFQCNGNNLFTMIKIIEQRKLLKIIISYTLVESRQFRNNQYRITN